MSKIEYLSEIKRNNIIKGSSEDTKARYERRLTVSDSEVHYYSVDVEQFLKTGSLFFRLEIRDYELTIQVDGLIEYLNKRLNGKVNYKNVRKFLDMAFDQSDLKVDCTCPDFRYRFAYVATKKRFKANKPEKRPAKIRNPENKGYCCKHLLKVLNNKRWIRKYISLINLLLKLNPETLGVHQD